MLGGVRKAVKKKGKKKKTISGRKQSVSEKNSHI